MLDIQSFRGADYLLVAEVMERSNLQKLNKAEDKEQYPVKISNRFASLENVDDIVDINRAQETITETTGYYKLSSISHGFTKVVPNCHI
jgi:hypothetical protein